MPRHKPSPSPADNLIPPLPPRLKQGGGIMLIICSILEHGRRTLPDGQHRHDCPAGNRRGRAGRPPLRRPVGPPFAVRQWSAGTTRAVTAVDHQAH